MLLPCPILRIGNTFVSAFANRIQLSVNILRWTRQQWQQCTLRPRMRSVRWIVAKEYMRGWKPRQALFAIFWKIIRVERCTLQATERRCIPLSTHRSGNQYFLPFPGCLRIRSWIPGWCRMRYRQPLTRQPATLRIYGLLSRTAIHTLRSISWNGSHGHQYAKEWISYSLLLFPIYKII